MLKMWLFKQWFKIFKRGFIYFGHGVGETFNDTYIERIHRTAKDFEYILDYWHRLGFDFISMEELLELQKNQFKRDRSWVHISMDDGYLNNLTVVLPMLEKRGIPFSVFITTSLIEEHKRFDTYNIRAAILNTTLPIHLPHVDESLRANADRSLRIEYANRVSTKFKLMGNVQSREFMDAIHALLSEQEWQQTNAANQNDCPMTTEQLIELAQNPLVYIGAHGMEHLIHNKDLETHVRKREIEGSKEWLENLLGRPVEVFAFPNGTSTDIDDTSVEIIKNSGYKMALTTVKAPLTADTDSFKVPRHFLSYKPRYIKRFLVKN